MPPPTSTNPFRRKSSAASVVPSASESRPTSKDNPFGADGSGESAPNTPISTIPAVSIPERKGHAQRASLDVQAFQRLLLTGSAAAPVVNAIPEGATATTTELTAPTPPLSQITSPKKPPPPPSSRHGRSIKSVDLTPAPPTLNIPQASATLPAAPPPPSPRRVTPTFESVHSSQSSIHSPISPATRRRETSDPVTLEPKSPKPIPPPPRRKGPEDKAKGSDGLKSAKGSVRGAKPPPPPARGRRSARSEDKDITSPGASTLASSVTIAPAPVPIPTPAVNTEATDTTSEEKDYLEELRKLQRDIEQAMKGGH